MKNNFRTIEFQEFIVTNKIKKKELAEYLNVSTAFISQLAQGARGIPDSKVALLKQNVNWNTSMFDNVNSFNNPSPKKVFDGVNPNKGVQEENLDLEQDRVMNHAEPPLVVPLSMLMERLDKKDALIDSLIKTIASQQRTIEILATKIGVASASASVVANDSE